MEVTRVVALSMLLCVGLLALTVTSASASPEITVMVDGESVADGETAEVDVSPEVRVLVDSETTLTSVRVESGSMFSATGLDRRTYNATHSVTVLSEQDLTVEVRDETDATYSHRITLTRPSETSVDLQRDVRTLQDRVNALDEEVRDLEEYRDELERTNQNLTQTLAELEDDDGEDDGDEPEGMPGFTAFVALVALSFALVYARRRE